MEFLSHIIRISLLGKNLKIKIVLINCCGLNPFRSLNDIFQVLNSNPSLTSSSTIIPAPLPIVNNRNSSRNFRAATVYSPSQHGDDPWLRFMWEENLWIKHLYIQTQHSRRYLIIAWAYWAEKSELHLKNFNEFKLFNDNFTFTTSVTVNRFIFKSLYYYKCSYVDYTTRLWRKYDILVTKWHVLSKLIVTIVNIINIKYFCWNLFFSIESVELIVANSIL